MCTNPKFPRGLPAELRVHHLMITILVLLLLLPVVSWLNLGF